MNQAKFSIKSIKRYQNPIKYASYFHNLKNVQAKLKTSTLINNNDKNSKENKALESCKYYNPFDDEEANEGEKFMFHVKRYQTYQEILGLSDYKKELNDDWGFLPFKKIDANVDNKNEEEDQMDFEKAKDDIWMNLGNNALYFTVNPTEKVL